MARKPSKVFSYMDKRSHNKVPLPEVGVKFEEQSELVLLAQTVLGEAEGECWLGKLAVASVIMNRVRDPRWGDTVQDVALQKWQFSCFNAGSPRIAPMMRPRKHVRPEVWEDCVKAAAAAFFGLCEDVSEGADHYLVTSWQDRTAWARDRTPVAEIGDHSFFKITW